MLMEVVFRVENVLYTVCVERPGHTFDMRLPLGPVKDLNEVDWNCLFIIYFYNERF